MIPPLVQVGLASLAMAFATSQVLGAWLASSSPLASPSFRAVLERPVDAALDADLLGQRLGLAAAPAVAHPTTPEDRLLGTLVSASERWSLATLDDGRRARTVRCGDAVGSFTVDSIERGRVWLAAGSERISLSVGVTTTAALVPLPTAAPRADGVREIKRSELAAMMARPLDLLGNAFFTPTARGFLVARLAPGSPLAKLGLQQGDELRSLNGQPLSDPETLLGALHNLPSVRRAQIDLSRGGTATRLDYEVL
jgi:type II secretory pathway component PulC